MRIIENINIKKERIDNKNEDVVISFVNNISEKLKKSETFKECMKNIIPAFITWLLIGIFILIAF